MDQSCFNLFSTTMPEKLSAQFTDVVREDLLRIYFTLWCNQIANVTVIVFYR